MSRESEEMGEEQHMAQFDPDLTSEPDVFTKEEIAEMNKRLNTKPWKPIDWEKGLDGDSH